MIDAEPDAPLALRLYVREELPPPSRKRADAVSTRGRALAEAGAVDEFHEARWPKRVPIEDCEDDLRDAYLAFAGWAADADVSLQPFFQTRVCFGPETGERADWLVLPAFALAVEAGDEVVAVYPHASGHETVTVEEGLDALAAAHESDRATGADPGPLVR